MRKRSKKVVIALLLMSVVLSFTGCGKKCENGCGEAADPECMANMCDKCCIHWVGLNGCYADHK